MTFTHYDSLTGYLQRTVLASDRHDLTVSNLIIDSVRSHVTPKHHNRLAPQVAYVIIFTPQISTKIRNLIMIPQGVSFPRMCEIGQLGYSTSVFQVLLTATAQAP